MNTPLTCSPVPMASMRNRTSILRCDNSPPVYVQLTGSYWPRVLVIEENDNKKIKGKHSRKTATIKPTVVKVQNLTKKNKALLKFMKQSPKSIMSVSPAALSTSTDAYLSMVSSATDTTSTPTSSPIVSASPSWDAPATPERKMTGGIWPHAVNTAQNTRPYSPTSILRPRTVSMA